MQPFQISTRNSDSWRNRAACKDYSIEFFCRNDIYVDDRDRSIPLTKDQKAEIQHVLRLAKEDEDERTAEGRLICAECPVRLSCLSHFFEAGESSDLIYGGYRMWVEDDATQAEHEYNHL